MMSVVRTRRQPQSLASDWKASRATSSEDDDNRLRAEEPLEEMLPGRDLAADWADIDGADGSEMERGVELAGAYVVGEDAFVPVAPKRVDEFMCSSCFLIHHVSRLASSKCGQRICTDCA